jgi:hypothetical protein
MNEDWDFFFHVLYQSTDESDDSEVLDPDTESDNEVDVVATKKPWVTRPPTYCSRQVLNIVLILVFADSPD